MGLGVLHGYMLVSVSVAIVLLLEFLSYGSCGSWNVQNGQPRIRTVEKAKVENSWYLRIYKRSVNESNEIGGINDNAGVATTTGSSVTKYLGNQLNTTGDINFESVGFTSEGIHYTSSIPKDSEKSNQTKDEPETVTQEISKNESETFKALNGTIGLTTTINPENSLVVNITTSSTTDSASVTVNTTTLSDVVKTTLPTTESSSSSLNTSLSSSTSKPLSMETVPSLGHESENSTSNSTGALLNGNEDASDSVINNANTTLEATSVSPSTSTVSLSFLSTTTQALTLAVNDSQTLTPSSFTTENPGLQYSTVVSGNSSMKDNTKAEVKETTEVFSNGTEPTVNELSNTTEATQKVTTALEEITTLSIRLSVNDTSEAINTSDKVATEPVTEPEYNTMAPSIETTITAISTEGYNDSSLSSSVTTVLVNSTPSTSVTNATQESKENTTTTENAANLGTTASTNYTQSDHPEVEPTNEPESNRTTTVSNDEVVPIPTENITVSTVMTTTKEANVSASPDVTNNSKPLEVSTTITTSASSSSTTILSTSSSEASTTVMSIQNTTSAEPEPELTTRQLTQTTLVTTKKTTVEASKTSSEEPSSTNTTPSGGFTDPKPEPEPSDDKNSSTTTVKVETETTSPQPSPEPHTSESPTEKPKTDEASTDKPEAEGGDSEPEGEKDPGSKHDRGDAEGEPEVKDKETFAEPGPDWKLAKSVWKEAWEFHVYFFGLSFSVLGFYCLFTLIRLWNMEHLLSKHYFITLHVLVISVCVLRAIYLLVDAYNSSGKFPPGVDYFLYSTAFPCLTALFSILFYALLLATRVRVISQKVQKLWVLLLIIIFHFLLSVVTDVIAGLYAGATVMIFVCQLFFVAWGLLMFVGYLILFRKLYKGALSHQKTLNSNYNEHKNSVGNAFQAKPKHRSTMGLAVKITFISAFFGVAIVGFEMYGMFGVYGALNHNRRPEPWPWWSYHAIVRSLELIMCISVAFVASQPLRYRLKKNTSGAFYEYCVPCSMCFCPGWLDQNETYSSTNSLDFVVTDTDHLSWLKKMRNKRTPSPKAPYPPHTAEKYSDPDATLLVRKFKRSKPSMLVVEDGFVRIKTDEEILPSNQYELDTYSRSSLSSGLNSSENGAINSVVNWNYISSDDRNALQSFQGVNLNDFIQQGNVEIPEPSSNVESADDTDIEIVVTESEHESDNRESPESNASGKSANIFRPLSLIDLAASMESELERAFHSGCVDESDLISHNSLPASLGGYNSDSEDFVFNENMYDKQCENGCGEKFTDLDATNDWSDSADDQSKSCAAKLLHSPVRRCKSEDNKLSVPKYKHFEKHRYFSVSSVDTVGKEEDQSIEFPNIPTSEMVTEL